MAMVKRIAWVLIGVIVGALTTGSMMGARQQPAEPSSRLVVLGSSSPVLATRNASLIKDTKSDGCWLLVSSPSHTEPLALAPAPQGACAVK